jgi:YHS domain-containing protein
MRALVYLVVLLLAVIVVGRILAAWRRNPRPAARVQRDELVKDPVCQTYIVLSRAVTQEVGGTIAHFCSRECAARFARGERRR